MIPLTYRLKRNQEQVEEAELSKKLRHAEERSADYYRMYLEVSNQVKDLKEEVKDKNKEIDDLKFKLDFEWTKSLNKV